MTIRLLLAGCLVTAAATTAAPATALPCDLPQSTVPQCLKPSIDRVGDRLKSLCFPPDPNDPYGC